jgi:hypothetical protein
MNNKELMKLFQSISKSGNCFDRELAMRKAKKEYKKSEFYKQTHMSMAKAYLLYLMNPADALITLLNSHVVQELCHGNIAALLVELEDFLENFDYTKLDGLFAYIEEKINTLNIDSSNLQIILDKAVKDFQESLK